MMSETKMAQVIAKRVHELRTANDLTMAKLAQMTGVTRSMISQLEKGDTLPSLQTLNRISTALGISINDFFNEVKSGTKENNIIVRADQHKKLILPGSNIIYNLLSPSEENTTEFVLVEIPGGETEAAFSHPGKEYFYVIEGEIIMSIGGVSYTLYSQDSGCFDSSAEHYLRNETAQTAKLLVYSDTSTDEDELDSIF